MPITVPVASALEDSLNEGWDFQQHIGDNPTGRFALCRVWHGYVMAAYQSGSSVKARFYDPYQPIGQNWIGSTITLADQSTANPVALCYVDLPQSLSAILFSTMGEYAGGGITRIGISFAQLPNTPANPSQSWDFSSVSFSSPIQSQPGPVFGPSVQVVNGGIAIAYGLQSQTPNVAALSVFQIYTCDDPTQPPVSWWLPGQSVILFDTAGVSTICEPALILFKGNLYCYTVNAQQYIQVTQISQGKACQVTTTGIQTDVAPAVTVDPTGTIVILVYKKPGSGGQPLMFNSSADGTTFNPQGQNLIAKGKQQGTKAAPTLLSLKTGQILLVFQSGSGSGSYSLCPSSLWTQPNGLNVIPPGS
jgi:hypothetical protein